MIQTARSYDPLDRDSALAWARALWREPMHERRMAAIEVLRRYVRTLRAADLRLVEAWVREAHGWAYVDSLAGDVAGRVALDHRSAWPLIDAWAADEDFWVRRSALLTLLPAIRQGRPDHARFERYATPMLAEKEFFIRKAIGWVLREISKKDPPYVAAWTQGHLDQMSGVTFREAVRRLPRPRPPRCSAPTPAHTAHRPDRKGSSPRVKDAIQRSFRLNFGQLVMLSPGKPDLPVGCCPSRKSFSCHRGAWSS